MSSLNPNPTANDAAHPITNPNTPTHNTTTSATSNIIHEFEQDPGDICVPHDVARGGIDYDALDDFIVQLKDIGNGEGYQYGTYSSVSSVGGIRPTTATTAGASNIPLSSSPTSYLLIDELSSSTTTSAIPRQQQQQQQQQQQLNANLYTPQKKVLPTSNTPGGESLTSSSTGFRQRFRSIESLKARKQNSTRRRYEEDVPRYTFYSEATGVIQGEGLDGLDSSLRSRRAWGPVEKGLGDVVREEGKRGGWFWMDVLDPSEAEMKCFSKIFGIHPLTTEDLLTEETREKCEIFTNYYYLNVRSFDQNHYSMTYLQPVNVGIVVFRDCVLSFHSKHVPHPGNVLRRMEQLRLYGLKITPDWINYALIDDIVDSFMPVLRVIELEVDSIDDLVLILRESEQSDMLRRIGVARKKVMLLLRLLSTKADVIKTLIKRSAEGKTVGANTASGANWIPSGTSTYDLSNMALNGNSAPASVGLYKTASTSSQQQHPLGSTATLMPSASTNALSSMAASGTVVSSDVVLYLGDIQDHAITMVQNLTHYEKTLSRSHSNYLAQISIELTQASNQTNDSVMKMTALASILVPLNVITGLWGMNVRVPGGRTESLEWFFGIIGAMLIVASSIYVWLKRNKLVDISALSSSSLNSNSQQHANTIPIIGVSDASGYGYSNNTTSPHSKNLGMFAAMGMFGERKKSNNKGVK